jgi:hypothetical protein
MGCTAASVAPQSPEQRSLDAAHDAARGSGFASVSFADVGGDAPEAAVSKLRDRSSIGNRSTSGKLQSLTSSRSVMTTASELSKERSQRQHARLRKLRELDSTTIVPFILVELRGEANGCGYVEVCGKDEYHVYEHLDRLFTTKWGCTKLDSGDLSDDTPVPFCDAMYEWPGFKSEGDQGTSNMGLMTMRLVDFMANKLGWTLAVVNGGNVGQEGEIREQQVIFKAPHPMNLVVHHCMVELRSAGYIEVCGDHCGILQDLEDFFQSEFKAERISDHEEYCDAAYKCADGIFRERGREGENNMGKMIPKVCDFIGRLPGWNLVSLNGGNYGDAGTHRKQQLVFRSDNHPLQDQPHLLVELRGKGYIEVCGDNVGGVHKQLDTWLKREWRCTEVSVGQDPFCDRKYKWRSCDMLVATAEIVAFFHSLGWCMQVCSQGTVKAAGTTDVREQQILFRPGMSGLGVVEPHLFIELYCGEADDELCRRGSTQVLANQFIRVKPIGNCEEAVLAFQRFMLEYLGGESSTDRYLTDCFLGRGFTDNNLGCWTMRVCDFMVDHLGWSFIVCNVCNLGEVGNCREQQLVFRFDGKKRDIPIADTTFMSNDPNTYRSLKTPRYWSIPEVKTFQKIQEMTSCDQDETGALTEILDSTFRRVLTRDRVYEYQATTSEEMPFRLELVHAFRSENLHLALKYEQRYAKYNGKTPLAAKTRENGIATAVNSRLRDGEGLLFHGTNPSSAISILKSGFRLNHAGKSTGTMFGNGIYVAECSSKSDEYAMDDGANTYPGLRALLVCRCLVGNPYIVHKAGDYISEARRAGSDCVLGDRESVVNTYREYVFFDETQVYPEYVIIYKRQYDEGKVPRQLRRAVSGTTGRNWQVKLDKGWANVPPDVNRRLLQAKTEGVTTVDVTSCNVKYVFDLEKKEQTNCSTKMVRKLRPPMVK